MRLVVDKELIKKNLQRFKKLRSENHSLGWRGAQPLDLPLILTLGAKILA